MTQSISRVLTPSFKALIKAGIELPGYNPFPPACASTSIGFCGCPYKQKLRESSPESRKRGFMM
jgi:hypothetical protein